MKKIIIGTRGSKLALWQANYVAKLLRENYTIETELRIIKTHGDKILDVPLAKVGGKGLFVKEIEVGDKAALKALSLILSDKIIFDIREKQGLAYRMTAAVAVQNDKALFYISLGTRPKNTNVLVPQFPQLMSRETLGELTEDEVQKAINMYLGRMMFRRLSSINQAYYLGTSLFFHNDMNHDQSFLDALKKVSLEDVKQVAEKYLTPDQTISIVVR